MRVRPVIATVLATTLLVPMLISSGAVSADERTPSPRAVPPDLTSAARRETEPVVLSGADFGDWAAPANVTFQAPLTDLTKCTTFDEQCPRNHYEKPDLDSQDHTKFAGTPVTQLTGWRWDNARNRWQQIPMQVDERFTRYLDNSASGFSHYSGRDQHTTYAFDREGFRYTKSSAQNPCLAVPDSPTAKDPVPGLDTNDELVFMAGDAGPAAPAGAPVPSQLELREVVVRDPLQQSAAPRFVYVGRSASVRPAFTSANGYVRYQRDRNADLFAFSQSNYESYGNAARGVYCDAKGRVVVDAKTGKPMIGRRRPRDTAWVTTPRYKFRYDGRWLMTQVRISPDGGKTYGPDVVDRWKARAFQQDRDSETPCCGYEEEDSNWGGSSVLMGERCGAVRCIREAWGADSSTNAVRRETFYRDEMRLTAYLRVHPIPPLDGIYAQWDFNAGRMTRFFSPDHPDGLVIDGINDDGFGNFDDPCNKKYDGNSTSVFDQTVRSTYRTTGACDVSPYHQSVDVSDPTFGPANAGLDWTQTSGPWGTIVDRYTAKLDPVSPVGIAQQLLAMPYYRDDSCFDDSTGNNPGPRLWLAGPSKYKAEPDRAPSTGKKRRCWTLRDGPVEGKGEEFYQGSIGTHGVHLMLIVDSDNARQTVPVSEIVSEQRMVFLPGNPGNVGEAYGRGFEKPLVATVDQELG